MPERIVVIGAGPVGIRFAEELLPLVSDGRATVTVLGAETADPYNRVLIAELAVGEATASELTLATASALPGVDLRLGARVARIDRETQRVELADGSTVAYDRLVLATGARSIIPSLDGLETLGPDSTGLDTRLTAGVCVLRDMADAEQVRSVVERGGRVVVLGAGVLGIELAMLLADAGAIPSVAHFGPMPMPRQLDRGSASILSTALASAGVTLVPHTRAEGVIGVEGDDGVRRFRALASSDGKRIEGDLLVLSCGVRARTELAEAAGLRIGNGVLVDSSLRSWSDPRIFAIGDCAHIADPAEYLHERQVPGGPAGLVGPGWRQASWLAASIAAELDDDAVDNGFVDEHPGVVVLKGELVDIASAGDVSADPFAPVPVGEISPGIAVWADPEHGTYVKMATRDGILTGFVAVGMPRAAAELSVLYLRGGELPADRSLLLRLDDPDADAVAPAGRDATLCICNAVTVGQIEDAIDDGCSSVAEVGDCTRAGTGCGGCRARITELLHAHAGAVA
ncbi:assimilatory nitrate reductase electron transfer subunit [Microbacterium phyllosphaerae]|uniref:Assimilatory nitrate reductase electron transfer subunit n=1 Tax=Microbacterium phyllosphaerae TaxID=124798 RepID=A0ABS4WVF8_9MICO|nr:FAD-dependent oxidoreductase [Microbacterium phyllosphaerae]MBP2379958.1 assimilatory nitrate reductase electron transfer subunit [Microbacterium phyllosphaerae]